MYRTSFVRAGAIARTARPFSTTMRARVDAADAVKDTAKKVDRTVSDQLVTGIDKSCTSLPSRSPFCSCSGLGLTSLHLTPIP